jgi:hypothetical protein
LQKLDPVQRDAILSSVMQGMTMEEAMHLVRDFVRKASAANNRGAPRLKNAITSKIPNKKRQEKLVEKRKRRLGRMLATLDSVQAHPIASAVESGTMGVDEVSSNMPSACLCSCALELMSDSKVGSSKVSLLFVGVCIVPLYLPIALHVKVGSGWFE